MMYSERPRRAAVDLAALTVFPNPVQQGAGVTLTYEGRSTGPVQITVLDAVGRAVTTSVSGAGAQQVVLPTTTLSAGVYLVQIKAGAGTSHHRLVVE